MEPYWNEANGHAPHPVKYESEAAVSSFPYCTESSLNFSTSAAAYSEDDAEYANGRRNKTSRQDPLSHRIIEKRRRDRMNSCLADLSRLIPPQYQRKGRGRIEKTEIIEMAIRHLKHLQSECMQKDNEYRQGYTDCMKEAAKFLYDSQMQDFCYRLLARLQEHIDEVLKTECYKSRVCHMPDNVSASSGSPHQAYHQPLCHLRDMLNASDIEHSNDHNDVKDLSFRNHLNQLQRSQLPNSSVAAAAAAAVASSETNKNRTESNCTAAPPTVVPPPNALVVANGIAATSTSAAIPPLMSNAKALANQHQQPHQAPVITSTAPASLHHHADSSNHDFESSREPLLHTDTSNMHSPPPRDSLLHHHAHLAHSHHTQDSMMSMRMRNFSESSHEIEHNNNYKYKNHIKERFNHELHDEETSSEHCPAPPHLQSEHTHSHSEHSKDGTEPDIAPIMAKKRKLAEAAAAAASASAANAVEATLDVSDAHAARPTLSTNSANNIAGGVGMGITGNSISGGLLALREDKPFSFSDIKSELHNNNSNSNCGLLHSATKAAAHLSSVTSSTTVPLPPTALARPSFTVPIFALHGQGNYYVPATIDYNVLMPFLNGIDLLDKNYGSMPVVHPININVNFMSNAPSASLLAAAAAAAVVAAGKQQLPIGANNAAQAAAAAVTKAKLEEAISHSW